MAKPSLALMFWAYLFKADLKDFALAFQPNCAGAPALEKSAADIASRVTTKMSVMAPLKLVPVRRPGFLV